MFRTRKNLGLAITDRGIAAVEVALVGNRRTLLHVASLAFSEQANLDAPDKLGLALRQMLRENHMTASHAVVGLAATWLAAREKSLPPTPDADSLRGVLSIAAEREFASGHQELAFDYLASPSGEAAILVAAPRRILHAIDTMAETARISVTAVTPSILALAGATGPAAQARGVLCLLPQGVEFFAPSANGLFVMRHLPVRLEGISAADTLANELRRATSLVPPPANAAPELLAWNVAAADAALLDGVAPRLGLAVRLCRAESDLELVLPSGNDSFVQAAALACATSPALDFSHSRLAPPKETRLKRRIVIWSSIAAATLLTAAVFLLVELESSQGDVESLQAQLANIKDSTDQAREMVDNTLFVRGWYDHRPAVLEVMREVTAAFPQTGAIYATSLALKDDLQVQLTGKASSERAALEVLDRLKSNPKLINVKPLYIRQAGGTSKEISFAVSLGLRGVN